MKNNYYIKWLYDQDCIVCKTVSQSIIPEKYRGGGLKRTLNGVRDNDESAIPVCGTHHEMFEKLSEIEWKRAFILGKAIFLGSAKYFYEKYTKFMNEG